MRILENLSLKPYNTFGIDVAARWFVEIASPEDLQQLMSKEMYRSRQKLVLGGGSNVLFTKNFDGLVIKNRLEGITIVKQENRHVWIKASAGVVWHEFVLWTIAHNFAGIENLSLIPGLVGAAPMQNIGAYGVEIKDVFEELEAVNMASGEVVTFKLNDCEFGYRESVFKHKHKGEYLISSVTFRLTDLTDPKALYRLKMDYGDVKQTLADMQVNDPSIKDVSDAVIKIRSSKLPDPKVLGNAGSFFKNPVIAKEEFERLVATNPLMPSYPQKDGTIKLAAGWLIEQCGWKGKQVGHTGSHAKQALVLVNYGGATGDEVYRLALDIQQSVKEKFGVDIQPEVNMV